MGTVSDDAGNRADGVGVGTCCGAAYCFIFASWTQFGGMGSLFFPSSTSLSISIVVSSSVGAHFGCCLMVLSSWYVASSILFADTYEGRDRDGVMLHICGVGHSLGAC